MASAPSPSRRRLVLATLNRDKARELAALLGDIPYVVVPLLDVPGATLPDETADTYEGNAVLKAQAALGLHGDLALGEYSGLEVDALGGAPGVRSKRWSGRDELRGQALDEANNAHLLAALARVENRAARYVCAAAFVDHSRELLARGETAGRITREPRGTNGFGYDPYFESDELHVTFGEATREAKEGVSHRGRAFRTLVEALARR